MKSGERLLSTSSYEAALQWDSLLEAQVAEFLPYELRFLLSSRNWMHATRVLDAGCGNGYYMSQLVKFFPQKQFVGIDISHEMIASAREKPALSNSNIWQVGLEDYEPDAPFDTVILRLIVQHLEGFDTLFASLTRLVRQGGTVVILEPEPNAFFNYPPTPLFQALLAAYGEAAARLQKNRAALVHFDDVVSRHPEFSVMRDEVDLVAQTGPLNRSPLMQIFSLWLDIFERSRAIDIDFEAVRKEINQWAKGDHSYNQVGLRLIELQRV